MGTHLFLGTGGETGLALSGRLAQSGDTVVITTHRRPLPSSSNPAYLSWDLMAPTTGLPELMATLGGTPLSSLSLFAHPPFRRSPQRSHHPGETAILEAMHSLLIVLERLLPHLDRGGSLLFFFPSLSHHRTDGYLGARLWVGALRGLFEEWSRNRDGFVITGIDMLVSPGPSTPHLTPEFIDRISGRTSRGRLATSEEIADFSAFLIQSRSSLFHGQILSTEGGPFY